MLVQKCEDWGNFKVKYKRTIRKKKAETSTIYNEGRWLGEVNTHRT